MAKFIVRRLLLMLLTMLIVSIAVFLITEASPGNVAVNVLGIQITPEQEASFLAQTGLDKPLLERYVTWLIGSDWRAANKTGLPLRRITTEESFQEWWAVEEEHDTLIRWKIEGGDLIAQIRQADGSVEEVVDNGRWQVKDPAVETERLEAYRAEVLDNLQLHDEDQAFIVEQLDRIMEILGEKDLSQEELIAALAPPESALEAMVESEASPKESAFQEAGQDILDYDVLRGLAVVHSLASPPEDELKTAQLRSMSRRLGKAANKIDDYHPDLAEELNLAAEHLEAGEVAMARETLASANVAAQLDQISGSLGPFAEALQAGDYQLAGDVLRNLSQTSLAEGQAAIVRPILKRAGTALVDADADLGEALGEAAASLQEGDIETAQASIAWAADTVASVGYASILSSAISQARVVRTFWGIDTANHAVRWEKGGGEETWVFVMGTGWMSFSGGPVEYIPLQKGLLRGDPGVSFRTGRPVSDLLFTRLRNSLVLAGIAFVIVMPLALVLGIIAGLNEGKVLDRVLSVGGMTFSVTPEFATGIFLILIFAFWLDWVPGATVFGEAAPWTRPDMLILPVLTLTLIELGYVLRITRASMVEVMKTPYIRTAFLKGLPYRRIVFKHVIRNALMAPITIIMLHVNWLLGGIVVVEVIFGYPGLGKYLLDAALFKDFNAIQAGAMILVAIAVGTQLLADIIYTFLNPRIRYA